MAKSSDLSTLLYPSLTGLRFGLWIHRRSFKSQLMYTLTGSNDPSDLREPDAIWIVSEPDIIQISGEPLDEYEFIAVRNCLIRYSALFEAYWLGQIKDGPELVRKMKELRKRSGSFAV